MMGFGLLVPLVLLLLLAGLLGWLPLPFDRRKRVGQSPEDILRERFARGELTAEEFRRMKDEVSA